MIITLQEKIERLSNDYADIFKPKTTVSMNTSTSIFDENDNVSTDTEIHQLNQNDVVIEKVEGSEIPDNEVGAINPNGDVYIIKEWNHTTLSKPTQEQIDSV